MNKLKQLRDHHSETEKSLKKHIEDYSSKLRELVLSKDMDERIQNIKGDVDKKAENSALQTLQKEFNTLS